MPHASQGPAVALPDLAIVGHIRKAHGVRGDFWVESHTDAPDVVFAPGARVFLGDSQGPEPRTLRPFTVSQAASRGRSIRVHLEGVADRDSAVALRGRMLFVLRSELDAPRDGEVFRHELIGMQVATTSGADLGLVEGWYELPQGVMLEVRQERKEILIPFHDVFVREVDPRERRITVELPEGFLD
ncbi:MAG: Ribosome maturation factor RimM [Gemmatimonadaceae bacterium]|nr:Ribosome maturation factor RimM [Gemmatimonadaceae bacterium]